MKQDIRSKIFNNNLNKNSKTIGLNSKSNRVNNMKYLPAFSKEWKNVIYSFNKNNLKNIPANNVNINEIIKGYFNLFFKDSEKLEKTRFEHLKNKKERDLLNKIFVSNAEIKYTSNKAKITLYVINRKKNFFKTRYHELNKLITFNLFKHYLFLYNNYIKNLYSHLNNKYKIKHEFFFIKDFIKKKDYIKYKLNYLRILLEMNRLALKKIWSTLIKSQSKKYLVLLRKYNFLHSLDLFKFNQFGFLSQLTNLLEKIIEKKLEYNIINLKSISYNADLFTDILALSVKKDRNKPLSKMYAIFHRAYLPSVNRIQERTRSFRSDKIDRFRDNYRDLKVTTHIDRHGLSKLLTNLYYYTKKNKKNQINLNTKSISNKIHHTIFNSIHYKHISGIRLMVTGRLTKRYRAERSVKTLTWKGGLKNIDSSFRGLGSVSFRGNSNSNISYSWSKSKRRVGSFAVKGWIGGK